MASISSLEPILLFKYPHYVSIAATPKVAAKQAFNFTAETFGQSNHFRLFSDGRDPLAPELVEYVIAEVCKEASRPSMSSDRHMSISAFENIEHDACDNLTVFLNPHAGHWRYEANAAFFGDKLHNSII